MSTLHLEPVVESTPVARHWIAAHLRDLPAEVTGCATLLTSELVTNAVLHAATPMCITLHTLPDRIRIDVADGNPAFPSIKEYGKDAATGRGLTLFSTLGIELGRPGGRRRQDRLVRAPGRLPRPAHQHLRRQLPLRPDRHHATRPPRRAGESHDRTIRSAGHTGGAPAEVQRRIRGPLPRAPAHEGAVGQRTRRAHTCPSASPSWCPRSAPASTASGRAWTTCGRPPSTTRSTSSTGRSSCPESAVASLEFYDTMLDEADEFGLAQRLLDAAGLAVERGGPPLVPLRTDRAAAGQGAGGLGRQQLPRRAAGGARPLSGRPVTDSWRSPSSTLCRRAPGPPLPARPPDRWQWKPARGRCPRPAPSARSTTPPSPRDRSSRAGPSR